MKRSLESPSSVFRCWTIIDLNPVAAGIVQVPEASPHTSLWTGPTDRGNTAEDFCFACLGEAVGRGLGWPAEMFLSAYSDNRGGANAVVLEESLVMSTLIEHPCCDEWTRSATERL